MSDDEERKARIAATLEASIAESKIRMADMQAMFDRIEQQRKNQPLFSQQPAKQVVFSNMLQPGRVPLDPNKVFYLQPIYAPMFIPTNDSAPRLPHERKIQHTAPLHRDALGRAVLCKQCKKKIRRYNLLRGAGGRQVALACDSDCYATTIPTTSPHKAYQQWKAWEQARPTAEEQQKQLVDRLERLSGKLKGGG